MSARQDVATENGREICQSFKQRTPFSFMVNGVQLMQDGNHIIVRMTSCRQVMQLPQQHVVNDALRIVPYSTINISLSATHGRVVTSGQLSKQKGCFVKWYLATYQCGNLSADIVSSQHRIAMGFTC